MDNAQQILKKYKSRVTVCSLAVFFIHMVIAYTLSYVAPTFALLILVFLYVFAIRVLNNYFWRKYISGILLNDVDAHFYRDIVIAGKFGERNPLFTMESEFFVGNVTAAMQVGNAILKNEKLAKKYGVKKQMISGVHFNFSFKDETIQKLHKITNSKLTYRKFKDEVYLKIARNYLRHCWLIIYLTGCSIGSHESFSDACIHLMDARDIYGSHYSTKGPSIRNSSCGYKNLKKLYPSYRSVDEFTRDLGEYINKGDLSEAL